MKQVVGEEDSFACKEWRGFLAALDLVADYT